MYSYYNLFSGGAKRSSPARRGARRSARRASPARRSARRASPARRRASPARRRASPARRRASPARRRASPARRRASPARRRASPARRSARRASPARRSARRSARRASPKKKKSKCGSGNYFKNGHMKKVGSKVLVWRGCRHHTASGQTKGQLMKNKRGKIVSKAQHAAGVKAFRHLKNSGKMMTIRKGSNKPVKASRRR